MSILIFLILIVPLIIIVYALIHILDEIDKKEEKDREDRERLFSIQRRVDEGIEELIEHADRYGDKLYISLTDFADKMAKLCESDIKKDLKPYDIYNSSLLVSNRIIGIGVGRIVINKNLEPRFMLIHPSLNQSEADIELEAALTIDEVKRLANWCKNIKMNHDIDKFRQNKVQNIISR